MKLCRQLQSFFYKAEKWNYVIYLHFSIKNIKIAQKL